MHVQNLSDLSKVSRENASLSQMGGVGDVKTLLRPSGFAPYSVGNGFS